MKKSAFTIIELSVVLAIIIFLVSGIIGSSVMIKNARLASARNTTVDSNISNISGLLAWYETSLKESFLTAQRTENSQLSSWFDISPQSIANQRNTLTKSANSSVVYIENGINNIPSIRFNGSDKFTIASLFQGSSNQITVFLVLKPEFTPSSTQIIPFDAHVAQSRFSLGIKNNAVQLNAGSGSDTLTAANPANFINSKNYIICAYFNLSNSMVFVNDLNNMAGNSQINAGTNALTGLSIGADKNTASGFTGLISEVIIFNRPLKLDERRNVMSYLSTKYKINITGT